MGDPDVRKVSTRSSLKAEDLALELPEQVRKTRAVLDRRARRFGGQQLVEASEAKS
jgi:hypothetical protein